MGVLSEIEADIVAEVSADLQEEFHVKRAGHRILAVRSDLFESQLAVHGDGIFHHGFDCIKAHAVVADLAGFGADAVSEDAAQPFAAELWTKIKALHLADVGFEFVQGDAGGELPVVLSEQEAAFRRGVVSWKTFKFLVEILEAEAEA